jgi:predicted membrane protein
MSLAQVDIAGNKTSMENVFADDLADNEKILKHFEVDLKPPSVRNPWVFWTLTICTFVSNLQQIQIIDFIGNLLFAVEAAVLLSHENDLQPSCSLGADFLQAFGCLDH